MVKAQYRDGSGKWTDIPTASILTPENHEKLAYEYCKQHGLSTRLIDPENKEGKPLKEFKCQKRPR